MGRRRGTHVPVSGLKIYTIKEVTYCYDRVSGKRIMAEIGTTAFHDEVKAAREPAGSAAFAGGTLGAVMAEYMSDSCPEWTDLRPDTQKSYRRAFAALEGIRSISMSKMTRGAILKLRNEKLKPKHGRWMANYAVTVLGVLFAWAVDNEIHDIKASPLEKRVKRLRKPREEAKANRPWTPDECETVVAEAPTQILIPVALAMFSGLRKRDLLTAPLTAVKDGEITVRTSKRDKLVKIPVHPRLAEALKQRPTKPERGRIAEKWPEAVQIAITSHGLPWTESGFNSTWSKFKAALEKEGKVAPGLTIHGLRHTLGTRLREAGADDRTIADVLGQDSVAMGRHYSDDAELPDNAQALVLTIDPTKKRVKGP